MTPLREPGEAGVKPIVPPSLRPAGKELWRSRGGVVLVAEVGLSACSYLLAVWILHSGLRWNFSAWAPALPTVIAFRFLGLYLVGLYRSSLSHSGFFELLQIIKASAISSVLAFMAIETVLGTHGLPLALFILDWALVQFLLGGLHFGKPFLRSLLALTRTTGKRVLVVGAGDAGTSVVKELVSDPNSECRPVAILDDDPATHGTTLCGVSILGGIRDLAEVAKAKRAHEVFICIPSATRSEMHRILSICRQSSLPVRTLPTLSELIDGRVSQRDLRAVRIEDLLGREELRPQVAEVREVVGAQVVLVTGAGGSIGSELCRQVAASGPEALLLLEKSENSLFYIHRELKEHFPSLRIKPILLDTTLRGLVNEVFDRERPDIVFHAAAHKHVGLLQSNPAEAIRNNVLGTRNVALAASQYGTKRFVNISTDKAVSPENYMGLSKKLTEFCTQELALRNGTRFMNVRFGNVAGSTGSVLRLFWEQIQKREPLEVTDPRATRYFMSIAEAVYLILRAAGQGGGGETFVLEMGDPINIYELAKSMSLLAGYAPGEEVPIHFVGLRQGEKVDEQLWEEWEHPSATPQKGVLAITRDRAVLMPDVLKKIEEMEMLLGADDRRGLLFYLDRLFPDFAARRSRDTEVAPASPARAITVIRGELMNIPLSKPDISEREVEYVTEVLRSGKLSLGPKLKEFEARFAAFAGTRYAVATNSGTSALHLCTRALGIGPQDEVITTPFSFVASTNCILYEGAVPVFLDIDPLTLNIDPKQLRRFLRQCCGLDSRRGVLVDKATGRVVKAILPVHVFGLPCDMDPIMDLAQQYGLSVIEDACEALGAEYRGRRVGTFGDAAVFAFYPNKQITTGEGGMIVTDSEEIAHLCQSLRNQGREQGSSWLRHDRLGFNYRLSDIHSALGIAQLERVEELMEARDRAASLYAQALGTNPSLQIPAEFDGFKRSWFVYVVQLNLPAPRAGRDRLMTRLRETGVECQAYFPAIHKQSYVAGRARIPFGPLFRAESASDRCLAIPFFSGISDEEVQFVADNLSTILEEGFAPAIHSSRPLALAAGHTD